MKGHVVENVRFSGATVSMTVDGKQYRFDLAAVSSRLAGATAAERADFAVSPSGYGIHWPRLDEDLSIDGLLRTLDAKKPAARGRLRTESRLPV